MKRVRRRKIKQNSPTKKTVQSSFFISSRLDCCNSLYVGVSRSALSRRLLTNTCKREHITPVLCPLYFVLELILKCLFLKLLMDFNNLWVIKSTVVASHEVKVQALGRQGFFCRCTQTLGKDSTITDPGLLKSKFKTGFLIASTAVTSSLLCIFYVILLYALFLFLCFSLDFVVEHFGHLRVLVNGFENKC